MVPGLGAPLRQVRFEGPDRSNVCLVLNDRVK